MENNKIMSSLYKKKEKNFSSPKDASEILH